MGQVNNKVVIVLIVCFILASGIIYIRPDSTPPTKKRVLREALSNIEGWENKGLTPLEENISEALLLDEYVNNIYSRGNDQVFLYIGYYHTTKKVGAAHDPTVCFPGQGWVLSDKDKKKLVLDKEDGISISYSLMKAVRGEETRFLLYWFQSYDKAVSDTFFQKINSFFNKILNKGEDNAFVRFTMPIGERSNEECQRIILDFVKAFYPVFLDYVKEDTNRM